MRHLFMIGGGSNLRDPPTNPENGPFTSFPCTAALPPGRGCTAVTQHSEWADAAILEKTEAATYILSIREVAEVGPPAIKLFTRWEYLFKC